MQKPSISESPAITSLISPTRFCCAQNIAVKKKSLLKCSKEWPTISARVVQKLSKDILLYCPVATKKDFQSAVAYLIRRLDENTGPENFLRHTFGLKPGTPEWQTQVKRFAQACDEITAYTNGSSPPSKSIGDSSRVSMVRLKMSPTPIFLFRKIVLGSIKSSTHGKRKRLNPFPASSEGKNSVNLNPVAKAMILPNHENFYTPIHSLAGHKWMKLLKSPNRTKLDGQQHLLIAAAHSLQKLHKSSASGVEISSES